MLQWRVANAADAPLLRRFQCATTDELWDLEVQLYVSEQALPEALSPSGAARKYRLLLWFESAELVAVGAHQAITQINEDGTHLVVVALSDSRQGTEVSSGERLSDVVMNELIQDGLATHSGRTVFGVVHRDNLTSIAVCKRHRLTVLTQLPPDLDYRYVARRS